MTGSTWSAAVAVGTVLLATLAPLDAQVVAHNAQALENMRTQAEAGDPLAQFDLALLYDEGRGVRPDTTEAILWYERAAGHGFGLAQFHLGLLHAASVGGRSPDNVTACMWLTLAASRLRGDVRDRAIGQRDAVAARMTPAQLVEARRRVREWIAGQPQSR